MCENSWCFEVEFTYMRRGSEGVISRSVDSLDLVKFGLAKWMGETVRLSAFAIPSHLMEIIDIHESCMAAVYRSPKWIKMDAQFEVPLKMRRRKPKRLNIQQILDWKFNWRKGIVWSKSTGGLSVIVENGLREFNFMISSNISSWIQLVYQHEHLQIGTAWKRWML